MNHTVPGVHIPAISSRKKRSSSIARDEIEVCNLSGDPTSPIKLTLSVKCERLLELCNADLTGPKLLIWAIGYEQDESRIPARIYISGEPGQLKSGKAPM